MISECIIRIIYVDIYYMMHIRYVYIFYVYILYCYGVYIYAEKYTHCCDLARTSKVLYKTSLVAKFRGCILPIRGTASDVVGIISDTRFMKTVKDRRTVTSANKQDNLYTRGYPSNINSLSIDGHFQWQQMPLFKKGGFFLLWTFKPIHTLWTLLLNLEVLKPTKLWC